MSGIVSGVIGGVIATVAVAWVAKRVGKAAAPGQLHYGWFVWALGTVCLMASLMLVALMLLGDNDQLVAMSLLSACFFGGGLSCIVDAAFVRGNFDTEKISHSTPWTGLKKEAWNDLESVTYNSFAGWYTLRFTTGKKIRLSSFLGGHQSVLDLPQVANKFTMR